MDFFSELLKYYRLSEEQYLHMTRPLDFDDVRFDCDVKGLDVILKRVRKALAEQEKIIVYGDYDCDGIMSTSIIVKLFDMLGYPVGYYVPSRYLDGYGLNVKRVADIAAKGYSLIITVDNGISAFEAIDFAKRKGIDTIVVDHHEVQDRLPDAVGILHPVVSGLGEVAASGGFMSFVLATALLDKVDPYLLSLAGISTISDMMPLLGYNRDIVRLAIEAMNHNNYPAINRLVGGKEIDEKIIAMEIAPKVNAVGRMDETTNINRLVKYFVSSESKDVEAYGSFIETINETRKTLTKEAVEGLDVKGDEPGIVLNMNIKEGLIGLIANRLVNEYQVPAVVFTEDSGDATLLKGSMRSKEGFNITKAFGSLEKYLVMHGGHAFAGGLTIRKQDFDNFKKDFLELANTYRFSEEEIEAIPISLNDVNMRNFEALRLFSPFGEGFKEPDFIIASLKVANLTFISDDKHLSTVIGMNSKILGFNLSRGLLSQNQFIKLYGNLRLSEYRGRYTLEFRASSYHPDNLL
ncbi:MAG: DHH family phosphoesterase [Bacilli bacterium]|jgi:single-stranded-DNA-specific exonuclease